MDQNSGGASYLTRDTEQETGLALVELSNGHGRAVISSHAGATLRSLEVAANENTYELLSGATEDVDANETPSGVGSFIMAPWVNRIHRGKLATGGGEFELPINSGEHAMHGTVRGREWDVVSQDEVSATFRIELEEPWPFKGHVLYAVKLDGPSLVQTLEAVRRDH